MILKDGGNPWLDRCGRHWATTAVGMLLRPFPVGKSKIDYSRRSVA